MSGRLLVLAHSPWLKELYLADTDPKQGQGGLASITRFTASVDHIRSTAKWTLAAYAAVGAILIAGSQLSSIGKFDLTEWRLWVAVASIVVAIVAIALAVYFVVSVQTAGEVTLNELANEEAKCGANAVHPLVARDEALLAGYTNVRHLRDTYYLYVKRLHEASMTDGQEERRAIYDAWVNYLGDVVGQLIAAARYAEVSDQFGKWLTFKMVGPAVLAGLAVGVFAWAANPEEDTGAAPTAFAVPVLGLLQLNEEERELLTRPLGGAACVAEGIVVIVLSVTEQHAEVVSVPSTGCTPARFTVERTSLYPAAPVVDSAVGGTPATTDSLSG